jgi:Flp pilus assembly protein TadD
MPTPNEMYDQAVALKAEGKLEEAAARLLEIVAIEPNFALAHSALGVYLQKLGRHDEAIKHATRVTEIEPNDPFSFTQLSVILQRCGRIPEAEAAMARAHMLQASR